MSEKYSNPHTVLLFRRNTTHQCGLAYYQDKFEKHWGGIEPGTFQSQVERTPSATGILPMIQA